MNVSERGKRTIEPGLREQPIAFDGCRRNREREGGVFNGKSAEKPALDHTTRPRVKNAQLLQCLLQFPELIERRRAAGLRRGEMVGNAIDRDGVRAVSASTGRAFTSVVAENLPRRACGDREEMRTVDDRQFGSPIEA